MPVAEKARECLWTILSTFLSVLKVSEMIPPDFDIGDFNSIHKAIIEAQTMLEGTEELKCNMPFSSLIQFVAMAASIDVFDLFHETPSDNYFTIEETSAGRFWSFCGQRACTRNADGNIVEARAEVEKMLVNPWAQPRLWRVSFNDRDEDARSMMTRDRDHVGFTPGHQLTKIRGPDRLKWMKWFQSSQAVCVNEAMSFLTCELRAKLPAIVISDSALLDAAQGESWVHSKKNCAISPFVCMPPSCATECAGMSVQEFNDEADDVRKAKQTQIPNRALYTIGVGESLLRNTDRTQPQSRR